MVASLKLHIALTKPMSEKDGFEQSVPPPQMNGASTSIPDS
jgi:hypothetical protein